MSKGRRFSKLERAALYLAADGKCEACSIELEPGWHGDHVVPWIEGGMTDIANGAALCQTCNLKKGTTMPEAVPRRWQAEANRKRNSYDGQVTAWWVCMGAGKTFAACLAIRSDLRRSTTEQAIIVAPSEDVGVGFQRTLHDDFGICIEEWSPTGNHANCEPCRRSGVISPIRGYYTTYSMLCEPQKRASFVSKILSRPTTLVLDEVHHQSQGNSWGIAFRGDGAQAERVLLLSATPARTDDLPIPFVHDMQGRVGVDGEIRHDVILTDEQVYEYSYGMALADRVVPVVQFRPQDGRAVVQQDGQYVEVRPAEEQDDKLRGRGRSVLHRSMNAIMGLMEPAVRDFDAIRATDPRALLAVAVPTVDMARRLHEHYTRLGRKTAVVTSDYVAHWSGARHQSKTDLVDAVRDDDTEILVTVKGFLEGTDIPRTRVYVWGRPDRTRLVFMQALGRLLRVMLGRAWEDQSGLFFYYSDQEIDEFVAEVKRDMEAYQAVTIVPRQEVDERLCRPHGEPMPCLKCAAERPASFGEWMSDRGVIDPDGESLPADQTELAVRFARQHHIDPTHVTNLLLKAQGGSVEVESRTSLQDMKREQAAQDAKVHRAVQLVAKPYVGRLRRMDSSPYAALRGEVNKRYGTNKKRWTATPEHVESAIAWIYGHGASYLESLR